MKRIAIIGGGASGLMAACFAAGGNSVVVFEKQNKIGRKILVSGNGRCNIANRYLEHGRYHGENPGFVRHVFARFGLDETVDFFASIGLPLVEENNGRLFPAALQSSSVVKIFQYELERKKVEIRMSRKIERVVSEGDSYRLVTAGREEERFDAVVLSAGSCAFPPAGGSRNGYELAVQLGHTVREPFPALLPITVPLKMLHRLQGVKWDCGIRVMLGRRVVASSQGEVLFTGYGISGPASLEVSREVNRLAIENTFPDVIIDFFPGIAAEDLKTQLVELWRDGAKSLSFSLAGIIKNPIPEVIMGIAGIDPARAVHGLTGSEKERLIIALKALRLAPGKPRGFEEAVVAAGGVSVDEVDPSSMESRIARNLYLTGELLDIDGDSGGYNLQFAWSTGAIAGMSLRTS